ncbi:uncharacterized protein LOC119452694 [Dermacentor silvarum]|uniref:uncharacterized protein LOC119452694 n=1 Tax=Dermacentor silvarum TaxID=543639 RepID=UPI00189A666E|nr:uncharacterized protein LOC119452694 [Dermacentor silvarum]
MRQTITRKMGLASLLAVVLFIAGVPALTFSQRYELKGSPNAAYSGEIFGAPESLGGGYETGNLRAINTGSMPGLHPQMPSGPYGSQMGFQPFHQLQPLNRYALGNALFRATSAMVNNGEPVYGDGLYGGAFGNHRSPGK